MNITNYVEGFVEYAKRAGSDSSSILAGILALASFYRVTIAIDSRTRTAQNHEAFRDRLTNMMEHCHTLLYYVDGDDLDGSRYKQFLSIIDNLHESLNELASDCTCAEATMMLTALSHYRSAILIAGNIINERKIMEYNLNKDKVPYPIGYAHIEALIYHIDELIAYVRREKMR